MKAVGYKKSLPIDAADTLHRFRGRKARTQGPRHPRRRQGDPRQSGRLQGAQARGPPEGETKILGSMPQAWSMRSAPSDAVQAGRRGVLCGSILRQGTNSEFHLVDERIVGRKPKTLSFAQAAALPLTSITAWELLFDRLGAVPGKSVDPRTLLIVGGAGGVGSILIQLARRLTGLTVVATASRAESPEMVPRSRGPCRRRPRRADEGTDRKTESSRRWPWSQVSPTPTSTTRRSRN